MEALNGWNTIENSLKHVGWRIDLFCGILILEIRDWEE